MDNVVICRDVKKIYKQGEIKVHALTDVDLEVERGDFVCMSGPSGSGKSTLLNVIGGLDSPTSGEITALPRHPCAPAAPPLPGAPC